MRADARRATRAERRAQSDVRRVRFSRRATSAERCVRTRALTHLMRLLGTVPCLILHVYRMGAVSSSPPLPPFTPPCLPVVFLMHTCLAFYTYRVYLGSYWIVEG
eukprot:249310-Chlamydomonas_euryale.AAC.2